MLIALAMMLATQAGADEPRRNALIPAQSKVPTDIWLRMQREGTAASRHPQQLTPAERELALQRWLGSFEHEIPERFEQDMAGRGRR
ncbi:DUF3613 domain-containing protein [Stutzerimonas kirkiae]|uniref:DUF3613 domain-containing protein n=2 Tax=Stutzerimonas kirkiae TaxID=2211392 RepID=A0A4Q9QYI9_9GAMM|nr:DUF3613 domain-containing protein [Stutzerimonas kirkiae]TBU99411.1 DUF3613 domain-containing protein [Stutzerimonas kirkiae]TBV03876.1 DUF3613 domain-containing protein [Stutzerimonas kirkiae]TBV15055.1 DUF3613 domain-containing protein [Stutzerimonas kirkiae]